MHVVVCYPKGKKGERYAFGETRVAGWDALSLASAAASLLLAITSIWLWREGGGSASSARS